MGYVPQQVTGDPAVDLPRVLEMQRHDRNPERWDAIIKELVRRTARKAAP